jgi:serine/threonine-protein kinase RsbW
MAWKGARSFERTFPPEVDSARDARGFAREAVGRLGLDEFADRVESLVGELAVNAVLHARTDYSVLITVPREGMIRVQLEDSNVEPPRRKETTGQDLLMHGRGLVLIDALADRWGVITSDGGKCIWAEVGQ